MWSIAVIFSILLTINASSSSCPHEEDSLHHVPRIRRLVHADFVVKGLVKLLYTGPDNIHRALFQVHCVFKPAETERNISNEIVIRNVRDNECSGTFLREKEEVVIGLKERECISAAGDCDFEFDEEHKPNSVAFSATDKFVTEVAKTCELVRTHEPRYCAGGQTTASCPARHQGACVTAPVAGSTFLRFYTALLVIMLISTCL